MEGRGNSQKKANTSATSIRAASDNGGFSALGLSTTTLQAVGRAGYTQPTPVQAGVIPRAIAGVDVLGQAQTGTGKTASFVLPILELLTRSPGRGHGVRALVLVPTRELAVQVRDEFEKLAAGSKLRCVAVYGGKPIKAQIDKLAKNPEVVVGTPGRVLDHMSRGTLMLGTLELATLDEADRMLDIGFRPDIEKILRRCPQSRQTLLLSATVPPPVAKLATRYMRDPEILDFSTNEISVETIEQFYFTVDPTRKFALLEQLLEREQPRQAIVFCRTKRGTDKIHERLKRRRKDKKASVACIHGDLAQNVRDRVMRQFREGQIQVLVATDVVGRGIDVSGVSHIINYDIPEFCDDYVHRVGRTGRMGREGVAYTFVAPEEGTQLTRIEMRIDKLLERSEIAGFSAIDPKPTAPPPAHEQQSGDRKGFGDTVGEAPAAPKPAPSLLGRKRGPKRFRKAL
ncbi:MAG TPA: ATP-dependent helicase [Planctomycetaceae bacterium]|nr:ATP-dependent helicase [Planctomycetaceae bacterium]|tara:strand:- start:8 stop:1378 length:1371 start_codon:yes stop_codon:yes gene_type:complete